MQIESLKEYVMIDSTKTFIRIGRKQPDDAWRFEEYKNETDSLHIKSIGFALPLQEIYEKISW